MKQQGKLYAGKAGIVIGVYLVLRYLLPLVLPFFLAWLTVCGLASFSKKMGKNLLAVSAAFLLSIFFFVFVLIWGSYSFFCESFVNLYGYLMGLWMDTQIYFSNALGFVSESFFNKMPSVVSWMFGLFLYFLSILLFARDWDTFMEMVQSLAGWKFFAGAGRRMLISLRGWISAQTRIMFFVTLECACGYWFLKIPGVGLWAVLTGMIDALPVFGTGTIFVPWMLLLFFQKDYLFLWKIGTLYLITWLTRQFLEPRLLGKGIGLLPVCFLMSVILGLKLFGPAGVLTGPFGILLIRELWRELETAVSPQRSSAPSSGGEQK